MRDMFVPITAGTSIQPDNSHEIRRALKEIRARRHSGNVHLSLYTSGAFSEVKVARDKTTGVKYAIKIIDKSKCRGKESMIETEVNILKKVKHESIISLYEMYEIENRIYLVMELVTGGELFDEIVSRGKYTEKDAAKIVHKILRAIDYLHELGIAHRDLKPENLLLSDRTPQAKIMISDFGLSKIFDDEEVMRTACGTPGYVAPEVLKRQGYGREIDLWSLGVITYILLCGYPPFYDQNNVELFRQIMSGKYTFDKPWWDSVSDSAKDFIRHLLVLDPKQRYTARKALEHPWIVKYSGVTQLANSLQSLDISEQNLAQGVSNNLSKVISNKAIRTHDEKPGKPLSDQQCADSGVVRSNEKVSASQQATRPSTAATPTTVYLPPGPRTVNLLTYNIFLRPPGIKNHNSDYKDSRLSLFGEHCIKMYDIIALQEMFSYGTSRQSKMLQYARKAGYEYYVASPNKGFMNIVDGGLLILSKYPIIRTNKVVFKKPGHGKGVIYAKIAITPSVIIHLFNCHLQKGEVSHLIALKDFIDDTIRGKAGTEPVFVVGDFGLNSRSDKEYNLIMKVLKGDPAVRTEFSSGSPSQKRQYPPIRLSCKDIIYEKLKEHPITIGDTDSNGPKETVLTKEVDLESMASVDYMLYLNFVGQDINHLEIRNAAVDKFLVSGQPYTQLSDHYGLKTVLFAKN